MKKILTIIIAFLCIMFCACSPNKDRADSSNDTPDYIELTIENYAYYLSIQKVKVRTYTNHSVGGSTTYVFYDVTVNGAIDGLYENCVLTYKDKQSEQTRDVPLNAAGFATFTCSITTLDDNISYVAASGRIYIKEL